METKHLINTAILLQTRLTLESKESTPLHEHKTTLETYFVLSGKGTLRLGKKETEVGTGSFIEIPPGTLHKITNTEFFPLEVLSTKNSNRPDTLTAEVVEDLGKKETEVGTGSFIEIPPGTLHKITNTEFFPLEILSTKNSNR